jgi:Asp-tRNA(Asn)/Glu-tRNA(Gln) amidotransferase A subunit family amidase
MSDELTWMPAWRIRELIGKQEVSPVEVTEHFLGRIEQLDPVLKAFSTVDHAGARAQAEQAEQAVRDGSDLGPLHGIPVSIKDHIEVKGLPYFHMGSMRHLDEAPYESVQVERLRAAGAVIVGTNTEMGSGMREARKKGKVFNWDVESRSAWDQTRVPGWSSAGSATATVSGMVPLALGSDGGGSTRLPAAYSGVVGIAATPGRIPWIHPDSPPIALTASTGPLCRDIRDAAIMTQALSGPDGRDFFSLQDRSFDFVSDIDDGVDNLRFAWSDDFGYASMYALEESPRVIAAIRRAAGGFSSLGATVDPVALECEDFFSGFQVSGRIFGSGGQTGEKPTEAEFLEAVACRGRNYDRFMAVFEDHDVLLAPTTQLLAREVEEWDAAWTTDGGRFTHGTFAATYVSHAMMFNWLSFPAFNVPAGFVDGLPIGMQVIGRPGSEALMFRVASAFLRAFPRDERPAVAV